MKLRIFISSPGDVKLERGIAKRVVNELSSIYQEFVELETLMWEDLPLEATNSFQGGIDYFLNEAPIDIAIFILWSRLGSTLGHTYKKHDGSLYTSGTEYEFDTMYTVWLKTQKPKIMVYVKDVEPQFSNGMTSLAIKDALKQQEMLSSFIEEKFHDAETNTNYAYTQFDRQQTFEERLRSHLSRLIKDAIGQDVNIREWEGNPYVGLKSYNFEESSIYCGRKDLVYDVAEKMMLSETSDYRPPLFVLGESGTGKSSFVRAGLLPHLLQYANSDAKENIVYEIVPSAFHGNIYNGILDYLTKEFPILSKNPVMDELRSGINDGYNFRHLKYALENYSNEIKSILFIDQLEEIFSDNLITEDERLRTFLLLKGLSEIKCIQMIFSMRNDFYNRFTRYSYLNYIKSCSIVVDIPQISFADITEIVEIPAKKANLKWEINDKGVKLSKQIAKDAFALGQLPLIEFGLSELYNSCKSTELLTYKAYEEIGKLNGAIIKYADKLYHSFTEKEKKIFLDLLSAVITISDKDEMIFVRKTTLLKELEKSDIHKNIIRTLVNAHLFTSGKDSTGEPTITIVHEMLINSWSVIKEWCQNQVDFLKQNDYYEKQARYWVTNDRTDKGLIQERSLLLEAEYFLFRHEQVLSPITNEYITKSLKKERRKGIVKHCFIFTGVLWIFLSTLSLALTESQYYKDIIATLGLEDLNLWDITSTGIIFMTISGLAVWLRIEGKPVYKTIKRRTLIWLLIVLYTFTEAVYYKLTDNEIGYIIFILPVIFLITAASVLYEHYRRILWKKARFVSYLISDRFNVIKNVILYSLVAFITLAVLGFYMITLEEQNEKLNNTIQVADELFNGLNNISSQLSPADKIYVNEKRMEYIRERFPEELADTIQDNREYEYALCLYNLNDPVNSRKFLYPLYDSRNLFLYILNTAKIGEYELAATCLELYVENDCFNEETWANTGNLIWVAERAGRFDLAQELYEIVEKNGIKWEKTYSGYLINYGHIQLMNGNIPLAYEYYENASILEQEINQNVQPHYIRNTIEGYIKNDIQLFDWLGIGEEYLDRVIKDRNYPKREFYTHKSDTLDTETFLATVAGSWILEDSTIIMTYNPNIPLCEYHYYNADKNLYNTALTIYRSSIKDNNRYIEEYDEDTGIISSIEVLYIDDNTLKLRIIENGNDADRGIIRTYNKALN